MKWLLGMLLAFSLTSAVHSQNSPYRKELKRADLSGRRWRSSQASVRSSRATLRPFMSIGEKSFYVLEVGTIELPDGKQVPFPTGTTGINRRDVPHGAFKVTGDKTIKLLTVHIVDKGAPLYDTPK